MWRARHCSDLLANRLPQAESRTRNDTLVDIEEKELLQNLPDEQEEVNV